MHRTARTLASSVALNTTETFLSFLARGTPLAPGLVGPGPYMLPRPAQVLLQTMRLYMLLPGLWQASQAAARLRAPARHTRATLDVVAWPRRVLASGVFVGVPGGLLICSDGRRRACLLRSLAPEAEVSAVLQRALALPPLPSPSPSPPHSRTTYCKNPTLPVLLLLQAPCPQHSSPLPQGAGPQPM